MVSKNSSHEFLIGRLGYRSSYPHSQGDAIETCYVSECLVSLQGCSSLLLVHIFYIKESISIPGFMDMRQCLLCLRQQSLCSFYSVAKIIGFQESKQIFSSFRELYNVICREDYIRLLFDIFDCTLVRDLALLYSEQYLLTMN